MPLKSLFYTGKDYKYSQGAVLSALKEDETTLFDRNNDCDTFSDLTLNHAGDESDEEILAKSFTRATSSCSMKMKESVELDDKTHEPIDNIEFYEIDIIGADGPQSLHSIALKYNCSLWELKRVNSLVNNQDFHALRSIKIPAIKNTYRAELLQRHGRLMTDNQSIFGASTASFSSTSAFGDATEGGSDSEVRHVSIRDALQNDSESGALFLRSMDANLHRIRQSVVNTKSSLDEVTQSLREPWSAPLTSNNTSTIKFDYSNYCGISWKCLAGIICLVVVGLPICALIIYFTKYHSST